MQSTRSSVLVVGSIAFDNLEMPHGTYENVLGGAATYSAISASFLAPTSIVGVVGNDFADSHLQSLRTRGVDTMGIERASGKTFVWRGRYSDDLMSRVTLQTELNVFANFSPKLPDAYKKAPFLLLGNIHPALQSIVLDQVTGPKLIAADTMNFWISGEPRALDAMLKRIDLLIINDEEARELSGIHNIPKAAADIHKRGPKRVIVKRGEHGALLFDSHGVFFTPAYPLEDVRDPTGAGDTFAGGLMGYLARNGEVTPQSLRKAMFFGAALASFCVEDVGTKRLLGLTQVDLAKRLRQFVDLVDHGGPLDI